MRFVGLNRQHSKSIAVSYFDISTSALSHTSADASCGHMGFLLKGSMMIGHYIFKKITFIKYIQYDEFNVINDAYGIRVLRTACRVRLSLIFLSSELLGISKHLIKPTRRN